MTRWQIGAVPVPTVPSAVRNGVLVWSSGFPDSRCDCGLDPPNQFSSGVAVHLAGCEVHKEPNAPVNCVDTTPKKILLASGKPWTRKHKPKRKTHDHRAPSNYKLMLSFFFERPINIAAWKRIRAPHGWTKCPTSEAGQRKYMSVRFQCRDYKHALASEEIETLRAKLYLSLELTW